MVAAAPAAPMAASELPGVLLAAATLSSSYTSTMLSSSLESTSSAIAAGTSSGASRASRSRLALYSARRCILSSSSTFFLREYMAKTAMGMQTTQRMMITMAPAPRPEDSGSSVVATSAAMVASGFEAR